MLPFPWIPIHFTLEYCKKESKAAETSSHQGGSANMYKVTLLALACLSLTACGGGDDPKVDPLVAPINTAITFTSSPDITFVEDQTTFPRVTATHANGSPVTFAIPAGQPDSEFVSLDMEGNIRFRTPPSFETPRDANGDNVYEITALAGGQGGANRMPLRIRVVNSREGIRVTRQTSRVAQPVAISALVTSTPIEPMLIGEADGKIWEFNPANDTLKLITTVPVEGGRLLSIAADGLAGQEYRIYYAIKSATQSASVGVARVIANRPIFKTVQTFPAYRGETLPVTFSRQGNAYFATGGSRDLAQDPTAPDGKMYLINTNPNPDGEASPNYYSTTVVAQGLQNPASIISTFYGLFLLDAGSSHAGEINFFPQTSVAPPPVPINYGWPYREGTSTLSSTSVSLTDPLLQLLLGNKRNEGGAIVGGAYHWANANPAFKTSLDGHIVFGDTSGKIFTAPLTGTTTPTFASGFEMRGEDFTPDTGALGPILGIVNAGGATLVIVDRSGAIFKVTANGDPLT